MKSTVNKTAEMAFRGILIILFVCSGQGLSSLHAQFKWTSDYKNLYNEKVAVELELKSVRTQYSNEKANLESQIKRLEDEIANLNQKISVCEKQRAEDQKLADKRINELKATINLLQKKGSDTEQKLVEENKKLQERYENELKKVRDTLLSERNKHLSEMEELRKKYSAEISMLNEKIKNLNEDLVSLKNLTKSQKAELDRMEKQANELEKQLEDEIRKGEIRLKKFHDKLIINIDDRISFDSGSAELKKEILPALGKIANILESYPEYKIMVEGHTDNVPIKTRQFRNNWQLSTERALSVLGYLLRKKELNRSRFGAAGYGEYNPIVPNNSAANKALNRRVDIVVIPRVTK